mmetsp:Transcript_7133/g.26704  ORF Transcript_7133/g.26704 Transcript_7133/m.26704 type:complete len:111 (+) Transcript_7133:1337-1669(+)
MTSHISSSTPSVIELLRSTNQKIQHLQHDIKQYETKNENLEYQIRQCGYCLMIGRVRDGCVITKRIVRNTLFQSTLEHSHHSTFLTILFLTHNPPECYHPTIHNNSGKRY